MWDTIESLRKWNFLLGLEVQRRLDFGGHPKNSYCAFSNEKDFRKENLIKNIYVRHTGIKNISQRQEYLTSHDKQENLLAYTSLEIKKEFKDMNKELVIELPNELYANLDNEYYRSLLDYYLSAFKNETGYNYIAGAIHMNQSESNLHLHLSYVDRDVYEINKFIAKKDTYMYTSTGKKLKRVDYNEENPNHLKIKKGEYIPDYDSISLNKKENWKQTFLDESITRSDKFNLRRNIKNNYINKCKEIKFTSCKESGLDYKQMQEYREKYNNLFTRLNNELLEMIEIESKYSNKEEKNDLHMKYKKVGKIINNKPNDVQNRIIKYNDAVKKYNRAVDGVLDDIYVLNEHNYKKSIEKLKEYEYKPFFTNKNSDKAENLKGLFLETKTHDILNLVNKIYIEFPNAKNYESKKDNDYMKKRNKLSKRNKNNRKNRIKL